MVSTVQAIKGFKKTLDEYCEKREDGDVEKIIFNIKKVNEYNPAVYNEKAIGEYLQKRGRILKGLVEEYFITAMSKEFPLISEDLFSLQRYLTVSGSGKKWEILSDDTDDEFDLRKIKKKDHRIRTKKVKVPLFAYTPLFDGEHNVVLSKFSTARGYYRTTFKIEATLPGVIGPNLKKAYREALTHYFKTLSEMFTNPVASDIMYSEGKIAKPEIGAIWIPTPQSLNLSVTKKLIQPKKNIDPAMILSAGGGKYLVKTWRVDDEEPPERYLREFSSGSLRGKL